MNKFKFVAINVVMSCLAMFASTLDAEGTLPKSEVTPDHMAVASSMIIDKDIEGRLEQMSGLVEMKYTSAVRKSIRMYLTNQNGTIKILKRSTMYFPLFDQYLEGSDLPEELKYLAIVESGLNPRARSKAGAVGLWQFMSGTGKMLGLKINRTIDQRSDPHKSTQAAVTYLKQLYKRFGDWGLVLAAYNSGPGRVSSAIRKANSTDFWKIQKFLPMETRNYVPAFIAVSYLMNYHHLHNIEVHAQSDELVNTSTAMIYDRMTLSKISKMSGTSLETVKALNPGYLKNYIPASEKGHYLMLPQNDMISFLQNLYGEDFMVEMNEELPAAVLLGAESGFTAPIRLVLVIDKLPILTISSCVPQKQKTQTIHNVGIAMSEFKGRKIGYYRLKKRESLTDIARKHKNVTLENLLTWNDLDYKNPPKPGMLIKILDE